MAHIAPRSTVVDSFKASCAHYLHRYLRPSNAARVMLNLTNYLLFLNLDYNILPLLPAKYRVGFLGCLAATGLMMTKNQPGLLIMGTLIAYILRRRLLLPGGLSFVTATLLLAASTLL